jgi:hypothetical protein
MIVIAVVLDRIHRDEEEARDRQRQGSSPAPTVGADEPRRQCAASARTSIIPSSITLPHLPGSCSLQAPSIPWA